MNKIPWRIFSSQGNRNLWLYVDAAEWEKRFLCANILNRKWCFRHQDWLVETHNHSQSIISCSILITIMMACCNYIIIIGLKPNTIRLFFRCRDMITTNKRWMSIIKDISNGISCATIFIPRMFPPNNYFSVRCIVSFSC